LSWASIIGHEDTRGPRSGRSREVRCPGGREPAAAWTPERGSGRLCSGASAAGTQRRHDSDWR